MSSVGFLRALSVVARELLRIIRLRAKRVALAVFVCACIYVVHRRYQSTGPTVFVIEEHHEALVYWFLSASDGVLPTKGNTLIHIDAHSDMDMPHHIDGMSFLRDLRNENEFAFYMQKNDVFIQSAAILGLINRVIWIWPSWDVSLQTRFESYEANHVEIGWYIEKSKVPGSDETFAKHFCQCVGPTEPETTLRNACSYVNYTEPDMEKRDITIEGNECNIEVSYLYEIINEETAAKRFATDENWLSGDIILDIDEDYLGCENSYRLVAKNDAEWHAVEDIDKMLREFLCPKHIDHEIIGDKFLKTLLEDFMTECKYNDEGNCSVPFDKILDSADKVVLREFLTHPSLFCGANDARIKTDFKKLLVRFYELDKEHLSRILSEGFCLNASPKTLRVDSDSDRMALTVCHGLNEPASSAVYLHTPNVLEVERQISTLERLLLHMPPVNLVTLCRSVRDGYTPRNLSSFIEDEILSTVSYALKSQDVFYDDDLLGGIAGWSERL